MRVTGHHLRVERTPLAQPQGLAVFPTTLVEWLRRTHSVEASRALTKSGDDVGLISDLGLDVVGKVVGVVAREFLATRHGGLGLGRPHLLDAVLVIGIDNGGDIEVGLSVVARELDLAKHARLVLLALLNGVEVANELVGELDSRLLRAVDLNGVEEVLVVVGSEVDCALRIVESPECDLVGRTGESGRAEKSKNGSGEMHGDLFLVVEFLTLKNDCVVFDDRLS